MLTLKLNNLLTSACRRYSQGPAFVVLNSKEKLNVSPTPIDDFQSAVHRGREYEDNTILFLRSLGFSLDSCGKAGDAGIDFRGFWHLPNDHTVPVVGQCKREKKTLSSKYIREFAGSMEREPNTLGIIVSASQWSDPALNQTNSSQKPLILFQLDPDTLSLTQAVFNQQARVLLPQLSIAKHYKSDVASGFEISLIYRTE
eukprot:TRINITY_DN1227_c0_g2_i1.p1 TRINITY_DN1227_c0_g2~~TRINITY_DN1227_c0_g2_i1.p1  ORF type:complete len:200 (-),score=26.90 TRINITY_DN1227_c0_g2_i1:184-783(-)